MKQYEQVKTSAENFQASLLACFFGNQVINVSSQFYSVFTVKDSVPRYFYGRKAV